jgi:hypothetical protein
MEWSHLGWACYFSEESRKAGVSVYVRFGMGIDAPFSRELVGKAPLVIREVHMFGPASGAVARDLPIARMEAAANRRLYRTTGNPRDPGSYYPSTLPVMSKHATPWAYLTIPDWTKFPGWDQPDAALSVAPSMKLDIPADRRKPDDFYRTVADLYQWLSARVSRPAEEIADANGVPSTTVHRWIKEARHRGIMPAGQRGGAPPPGADREGG